MIRASATRRAAPLAVALLVAGLVTACGGTDTAAIHSGADRTAGNTASSAGLPGGNIAAGETQSQVKSAATGQSCIDCHGADGNVPLDATYPKLGGQYHDYLAHTLQLYRSGDRDHALMSNQARDLTDQQIADLAAYFASRPSQLRSLRGVHDR